MAAQNALTVAATAEAEMAAEVVGDAMNAVSVVSAQKHGPRVAGTVAERVARRADQTVAAQNEANAVNAHPTHAVQSNEMSREMTAKSSAIRALRGNHASRGKVVAKSARAVNAVNARTAAAAPMSSAHR